MGRWPTLHDENRRDFLSKPPGRLAQGKVVTQKVTWLGDDIPASNSTYFEVPVEAASNYRVRVFAYDWLETDGPQR